MHDIVYRIGRTQVRYGVYSGTELLLDAFTPTCEPLWHYTSSRDAAESLNEGRLWLTRADTFSDPEEIQYGLGYLHDALVKPNAGSADFTEIIKPLSDYLGATYVFSTTTMDPNLYLASTYAQDSGYRVGFTANLAQYIHQGWEAVSENDQSFRLHYVNDRFDYFEGGVIYDAIRQKEVAQLARAAVDEWHKCFDVDDNERLVACQHLLEALVCCAVLFKNPDFEPEQEYRVWLVRRPGADNLECEQLHNGRAMRYVDIQSTLVKEVAEMENL